MLPSNLLSLIRVLSIWLVSLTPGQVGGLWRTIINLWVTPVMNGCLWPWIFPYWYWYLRVPWADLLTGTGLFWQWRVILLSEVLSWPFQALSCLYTGPSSWASFQVFWQSSCHLRTFIRSCPSVWQWSSCRSMGVEKGRYSVSYIFTVLFWRRIDPWMVEFCTTFTII